MAIVPLKSKPIIVFTCLCSSVSVARARALASQKASGSEREALWDFVAGTQGLLIGDKGYLSQPLKLELQAAGLAHIFCLTFQYETQSCSSLD